LVALEVLRGHIGRLEAEIVSLKDEVSRERARGAQVEALTAILEIERKRAEELKQERDRWSAAAEAFQQQLVDLTNKPKGFFGWLRRA
jgi:chromosome segregation ATPase